jgi:hypothetical protein
MTLGDRQLSYPVVAIAVAVARLKKVPDTFCSSDKWTVLAAVSSSRTSHLLP